MTTRSNLGKIGQSVELTAEALEVPCLDSEAETSTALLVVYFEVDDSRSDVVEEVDDGGECAVSAFADNALDLMSEVTVDHTL